VTDENGAPLAGVHVEVDYRLGGDSSNPQARCVSALGACFLLTSTNDRGEYDVEFEPGPGRLFNSDGAALIYSLRDGSEVNAQLVARGATEFRQTLRLRNVRTLTAGHATTVSIDADSSLCSDLEDWWVLTNRCDVLTVVASEAGVLTVDANAPTGGEKPLVFFATSGWYTTTQNNEPGRATVGVQAGRPNRVYIGTPIGNAPARYEVSTSLR
jgi:hypothetical protein